MTKLNWIFIASLGAAALQAGVITQVTSQAGFVSNDSIQWAQLGAVFQAVPLNAVSQNGNLITLNQNGPIAPFDTAPSNVFGMPIDGFAINNQFAGPTTLTFGAAVFGVGFTIADVFTSGSSRAHVQLFSGNTSLGTFDVNAFNRLPVFLGAMDTSAEITKAVISMDGGNNFVFGRVYLAGQTSLSPPADSGTSPEPASVVLTAAGIGIALARRWWRA